MKVSKTISIELELLQNILKHEEKISSAIDDALRLWLEIVSSNLHKSVVVLNGKKTVDATVYVRKDAAVEDNFKYIFNLPEVKNIFKERNLLILDTRS